MYKEGNNSYGRLVNLERSFNTEGVLSVGGRFVTLLTGSRCRCKGSADFNSWHFYSQHYCRLSERLESATPPPGKNLYAEDRTRAGGFVARHANR